MHELECNSWQFNLMRHKEEVCLKILMCRHTYHSCTCVSGITYNWLKFWKNCTSNTPFLRRIKTWNMSPKKKDRKHTLLLNTNVPSSILFGWRRMCSMGRCAGHCATRSKSAFFSSDFASSPDNISADRHRSVLSHCCCSSHMSSAHGWVLEWGSWVGEGFIQQLLSEFSPRFQRSVVLSAEDVRARVCKPGTSRHQTNTLVTQ